MAGYRIPRAGLHFERDHYGRLRRRLLDRVDAYSDWEARRPAAPAEMVELVAALATHARAANPAFILMSQNSEPLLRRKQFRDLIDAVSKESLLYGLPVPSSPIPTATSPGA